MKEQGLSHYVSVKEASAWLGIPAFTLYSWALSRRLPHYKIGRRVLLSRHELSRWVDAHRVALVAPQPNQSMVTTPSRFHETNADRFLNWAQVNVSPGAYARYRCSLDHLVRAFGSHYLDEVTPATVEAFKAHRLNEVKPATINRDLMVLKRLYNLILKGQLLPEETVPDSLPRRIGLFRENNQRVRYLSVREYEDLLRACDRLQSRRGPATRAQAIDMKSLIILAVHTGMRQSEILKLRWADVDFEAGRISVHQGKGGFARIVPMNRIVAERLEVFPLRSGTSYVFCHAVHGKRRGMPFRWIRVGWEAVLREAGIANLRFHDLRHTAASWLVMAGVHLQRVQQILGHKSYQTTLRYAHLAHDQGKDAVERLCEVVSRHQKEVRPTSERTGP